jgi:hypothetical protein
LLIWIINYTKNNCNIKKKQKQNQFKQAQKLRWVRRKTILIRELKIFIRFNDISKLVIIISVVSSCFSIKGMQIGCLNESWKKTIRIWFLLSRFLVHFRCNSLKIFASSLYDSANVLAASLTVSRLNDYFITISVFAFRFICFHQWKMNL